MNHPLLYEINTRCWLEELSEKNGATITLANVPDSELARWRQLAFTHIWLMGVWQTGPRSRAQSLAQPEIRRAGQEILPGFREEDIVGSPYAIADYRAPPALGDETGLKIFHEKLNTHGLKLILDFVPNHLGLDHRWVIEQPDLFVQHSARAPGFFLRSTKRGARWLAHGRDPYFPPWTDTAQLDYRNPATHAAMIEQLKSVAHRCDGVRCDMAMLLLNEVFAKTWAAFPAFEFGVPPSGGQRLAPPEGGTPNPAAEFWADAIALIKQTHADFLFLAEVYWDLETRLRSLGFDYTYDKRLCDLLSSRQHAEVQCHLLNAGPVSVNASAHFLENHDERRIASLLTLPEHRAAALAVLGLPGLRMLQEGQLTGATRPGNVHLGRRPAERPQPEILQFYELLLNALQASAVGKGEGALLKPSAAWQDNPTAQNFVLVQWQTAAATFDLVAVNLAPHPSQCYVPLNLDGLGHRNWQMTNLLGGERYQRNGADLAQAGLYLDVPAHGAQLFHFQPII